MSFSKRMNKWMKFVICLDKIFWNIGQMPFLKSSFSCATQVRALFMQSQRRKHFFLKPLCYARCLSTVYIRIQEIFHCFFLLIRWRSAVKKVSKFCVFEREKGTAVFIVPGWEWMLVGTVSELKHCGKAFYLFEFRKQNMERCYVTGYQAPQGNLLRTVLGGR